MNTLHEIIEECAKEADTVWIQSNSLAGSKAAGAIARAIRALKDKYPDRPLLPDGYVAVPREPDDAFAERFCDAVNWHPDGTQHKMIEGELHSITFRELAKGYIRAMLAAARSDQNAAPQGQDGGRNENDRPAPTEHPAVAAPDAAQATTYNHCDLTDEELSKLPIQLDCRSKKEHDQNERIFIARKRIAVQADFARLELAAQQMAEALQKAARELNEIRARDGVPYTHNGWKASVDEAYFSSVVDESFAALRAFEELKP